MKKHGIAAAVLVGLVTAPAPAQQLVFGGEVRPRFEVRDPVPDLTGETREFTSMRTRLSADARLLEDVRAFVQFQDVRVWGEEAGTTDPMADGLDLHQGWLELGHPERDRFSVRVGRQELSYGGQRLVGALNWAQQARSFDGVRLRVRPADGVTLDGFATQVGDVDAGQPDQSFLGLYGMVDALGGVDLYALYHSRDRLRGRSGDVNASELSDKLTVGGRWTSSVSPFDWRIEAAYQTGEQRSSGAPGAVDDVSAYLLAVRVGTALTDGLDVSVWYDYLSGDERRDDELRVFDTLFATNHKFYGFMDLFLNIPAHTAGRGLQDLAVKSSHSLADGHALSVDLHSFRYAAADGLESAHIGEELDLTYRWSYAPAVVITGGASYFLAGDAPIPSAPLADDGMVWGYVMIDVTF
jgi:hypothetical protein